MLEHEPQEHSVPPSAAQIRVTPEELAAALNALEAGKLEAARHLAGTVPIGEVVSEMNLEATPEEIWAQVQRQRTQTQPKAVEQAQTQKLTAVIQKAVTRRVLRGWCDIRGWLWVAFWCSGGLGLLSSAPHWFHHNTPVPGIHITGDRVLGSYNVQGTGPQRDVTVSGDHDAITLRGDVRNLTVEGDGNLVSVFGSVEAVTVDNDGNMVHWTKELPGKSVQPVINGDGNKVGLAAK